MNNRKLPILVILVLTIILAIFLFQSSTKDSLILTGELRDSDFTGLDIGKQAPDFILQTLSGNNVQLSSFRGKKAVVVNFWATWCPPCREEFPAFEDIFADNKDELELLGVNLQESEKSINNFLLEIPVTFNLLLDPTKKVKELYNVFTQPVTYFINKEGIIVDKKFGPMTEKEIEEKFGKLGLN
jgi:peroxiredoxin